MRIVEVNPFHYPYRGGIEHRVHHLSRRLGRRHEVTVLTSRIPGTEEHERMDNYDVLRLRSRYVDIYNPPHVITPGIIEALQELDPDIVNFHYRWSGSYNKAARNFDGAKVFTFHNTFGEGVGLMRPFSVINDTIWKRHLIRFPKVICVSEFLRNDLISRGFDPEQLDVVPSCIEMPERQDREEGDFILFVGRLVATKGIPYLIEAMKDIDTRLVICGDGPTRSKLEQQVVRLGLQGKVEFAGHVSEEKKVELFQSCKVFVLPSVFESLGLAAIEAMSYGRPVVASDSGGLPEVVGEGGRVVPARDPKALSAAIEELLSDASLRKELGIKARERASAYNWDAAAQKIESIYEETRRKGVDGRGFHLD